MVLLTSFATQIADSPYLANADRLLDDRADRRQCLRETTVLLEPKSTSLLCFLCRYTISRLPKPNGISPPSTLALRDFRMISNFSSTFITSAMGISSQASSEMSTAHYRTHKLFLLSNYILLGAASSSIFLTLSLRLIPSAIGFLVILLHALTIAGAASGCAAANSSSGKWHGAHMVATVLTAILQGSVAVLVFMRTSEFLLGGLRSDVSVDDGAIILRMIGGLGVVIFSLEWVALALAFVLKYYAYVDGDCARRNSKVQSEEEIKNWPWPFQV